MSTYDNSSARATCLRIRVAAAVIRRDEKYLLTRRADGQDLAGFWEFPGGKMEAGETAERALVRELQEELGVAIDVGNGLMTIDHDYPEKKVQLNFFEAEIADGQPRALEVAEFGWFSPSEMPDLPILPADSPLVELLAARDSGPGETRDEDSER